MCKQGEVGVVIIDGAEVEVDACMVELIEEMNRTGTKTIGCCCGHGVYPKTVVYRAMGGNAIEYFTHAILLDKNGNPRKRKLYKKDENGMYHLPEVKS